MTHRVRLPTGWADRRYRQKRQMISWVRDPYLRLAKIAATLLYEQGVRGKACSARVREILPDIGDVPGHLIEQRGDKGFRYPREHYSANEVAAELAELVQPHLDHGMVWRR
jgi:hypothetical protein